MPDPTLFTLESLGCLPHYGIRKLQDVLGITIPEMIFVGDAVFPGGNDYPAKETGALSIKVKDHQGMP